MPASTVTVFLTVSRATTLFKFLVERRFCEESAILLKQCCEPSALRLSVFFTKACTCSTDSGYATRSVLYSRFPAQFLSLAAFGLLGGATVVSPCLQPVIGDNAAPVSAAVDIFRNFLFFIVSVPF